jgi:hypothetical protein
MRPRLLAPLLLLAICLVAGAILLVTQVDGSGAPSAQQRATQAALHHGRTTMVWESGPVVQSSRVIRLGQIAHYVHRLNPPVRNDINSASLIRQYGRNRSVDFVVLFGKFNTLPPDEGVDVHAQVLAVVDMKTDKTLLLMD